VSAVAEVEGAGVEDGSDEEGGLEGGLLVAFLFAIMLLMPRYISAIRRRE